MPNAMLHDTRRVGPDSSLAKAGLAAPAVRRMPADNDDLLLRELRHRCGNDLQLIVSLLELQGRRAQSAETRQALADVVGRVRVLARSRGAMDGDGPAMLHAALLQVREGLQAHADPRAILVYVNVDGALPALSPAWITTVAMVVNELTTNAIKHAFGGTRTGHVRITAHAGPGGELSVIVDDDGDAFIAEARGPGGGLGLELARRLMASIGGLFVLPRAGSKAFELRVPPGR